MFFYIFNKGIKVYKNKINQQKMIANILLNLNVAVFITFKKL